MKKSEDGKRLVLEFATSGALEAIIDQHEQWAAGAKLSGGDEDEIEDAAIRGAMAGAFQLGYLVALAIQSTEPHAQPEDKSTGPREAL